MRRTFVLLSGLCGLLLLPLTVQAEPAADPLRLVPTSLDVVAVVNQPRKLTEGVLGLEALQQLQQIPGAHQYFQAANLRRFQQFVTYYERELGAKWPELLDQLAGGGIVLASKTGEGQQPALFIIQGTNAKQMKRFSELALDLIEQEVATQEPGSKVVKKPYRTLETVQLGKEFNAAVLGETLVFSNRVETLHAALDVHLDKDKKSLLSNPQLQAGRKQLPADPLAWLWVSLDYLKTQPESKEVFKDPPADPNISILFGGWVDVARRSPYLCAGVYQEKNGGYRATLRMPAGRDGMAEGVALHIPPANQPGSRPLLEPKGVLYSSSSHFDLAKLWELRGKLFTPETLKQLEDGDKQSARFLAGTQLSKLLMQTGAYHRLVVVNQDKPGYKKQPKQPLPAFAVITELREPEAFAKSMDTVLRGVSLLAGAQFNLKLEEEKRGDRLIVGYRFPEDGKVPEDTQDLRFNASPCYVAVGKQFVFSSTIELARELVDLLEQEAKAGDKAVSSRESFRSRAYAKGGARFLKSIEDVLLTQAILGQALEADAASKQVAAFLELVGRLGEVRIDSGYAAKEWYFDARWQMGK